MQLLKQRGFMSTDSFTSLTLVMSSVRQRVDTDYTEGTPRDDVKSFICGGACWRVRFSSLVALNFLPSGHDEAEPLTGKLKFPIYYPPKGNRSAGGRKEGRHVVGRTSPPPSLVSLTGPAAGP